MNWALWDFYDDAVEHIRQLEAEGFQGIEAREQEDGWMVTWPQLAQTKPASAQK